LTYSRKFAYLVREMYGASSNRNYISLDTPQLQTIVSPILWLQEYRSHPSSATSLKHFQKPVSPATAARHSRLNIRSANVKGARGEVATLPTNLRITKNMRIRKGLYSSQLPFSKWSRLIPVWNVNRTCQCCVQRFCGDNIGRTGPFIRSFFVESVVRVYIFKGLTEGSVRG